ncbi:uncharacterized protein LOC133465973 [Phyllopteryx taeniolatus]|uniref:uncharacterized protein LOC133465973 n=1 Tax=Phyllopteryx taeniolatus TaxID=161469 RepID=UPI002AD3CA0D|nr:uncharacterized protein LOC133465973 [Phyllopteryx taeniolatus]XP_061605191.1 uncharacterized protein LOC133465973 [Phyllopteryx taeniolatus]
MGRLDDAAKRKVVELRKAGLSFRKIKAVLELENIKVSAQAIYLFLREFQGRRPGRVRPLEAGGNATPSHVHNLVGGLQESWSSIRLQHLLRGTSHHAGFTKVAKQASAEADGNAKASGCGEVSAESRPDQQQCADDNDVQIVSVTSLAQSQQRAETSATSSLGTASVAFTKRRVTPSPATSSMLAARKRILDKALTHRMKVASLLRRDHANVQRSDVAAMSQQQQQPPSSSSSSSSAASTHYDLTTEKTGLEDGGANTTRRFVPQRPGLSVRSLHSLPRGGIRLPNRPPATLASSAPGGAVIHMQSSGGPGPTRGEPTQSGAARGGLQDQMQTLGCEVRSLGLAVKMLAEQQSRLEREQVQQTHIQKQILSTLQSLASRAGPCGNARQARNKTPSPSCLPAASSSFGQDTFDFSQVAFSQCSQNEVAYNPLESLEPVEAFKLPVLNPDGMNGFPPCSGTENLPLTHTPPQTQQPYAGAYPQQNCQTLLAPYGQPYVPAYDRSHPQPFREAGSKMTDFESSCSGRNVQDCSMSTQDQNLNIIKVEGP